VHQVAQRVNPAARVVYVDSDPVASTPRPTRPAMPGHASTTRHTAPTSPSRSFPPPRPVPTRHCARSPSSTGHFRTRCSRRSWTPRSPR
jgi:hypothetical protein